MEKVDGLLGALLSREALPKDQSKCSHCTGDLWAVWRCQDCSFPKPLCRKCMRHTHRENPMHRIQRWAHTHFRSAQLWEVGAYILATHFSGEPLCETLTTQTFYLEHFERCKDDAEQRDLQGSAQDGESASLQQSEGDNANIFGMQNVGGNEHVGNYDAEIIDDETFEQFLDKLHQQKDKSGSTQKLAPLNQSAPDQSAPHPSAPYLSAPYQSAPLEQADEDEAVDVGDSDIAGFSPYLHQESISHAEPNLPRGDAFNNSYVRVVHTNGIHHLALVSCQCHGADSLPLDLVACKLLPTSFEKIRTVFSVEVLNYFRLCNLELKASAYQFYQLIRRLTRPMAPAEVVDLYTEFRRMSRLWRWMKKLKWAGYGQSRKDPMNVGGGELANYCPACPQPGINLPNEWKLDPNR